MDLLYFATKRFWNFSWVNYVTGLKLSGIGLAGLCHHGLGKMDGYHVKCLLSAVCQEQCLVPPQEHISIWLSYPKQGHLSLPLPATPVS
jgi:hypothetical protein